MFSYSIADSGAITVVAQGPIDYASALRIGGQIPADRRFDPDAPVLVDAREMDFMPGVDESREFARTLPQFRDHYRGKIAVLVHGVALFGTAQMICVIAGLNGFPMRAFRELEEALSWLESPESEDGD